MFRLATIAVVVLVGAALTLSTFVSGLRDASLIGLAQSIIAVLVTLILVRALRMGLHARPGQADSRSPRRTARMIALGLLIGIGGPMLSLWLLTRLAGRAWRASLASHRPQLNAAWAD